MPYVATRRFYQVIGKKMQRYFQYKKAKRLYANINRKLAFYESRYLKNKAHA